MDLNKALPTLLETATLEQMVEFVSFNLKPETIVAEMRRTEKFEFLPAFLPLLDLDRRDDLCNEFNAIYSQLLIRNEEGKARKLRRGIGCYLHNRNIALYYGKLTKEDKLPEWANPRLLNEENYLCGIAGKDNLELFIEAYNRFERPELVRKGIVAEVIKSRSLTILKHMQVQEKDLNEFLDSNRDAEAVEFLLDTVEPILVLSCLERSVLKQFRTSLDNRSIFIPYARVCLQREWVTIPFEAWQKVSYEVYQQFSSDV